VRGRRGGGGQGKVRTSAERVLELDSRVGDVVQPPLGILFEAPAKKVPDARRSRRRSSSQSGSLFKIEASVSETVSPRNACLPSDIRTGRTRTRRRRSACRAAAREPAPDSCRPRSRG
jgi:hypothetical protein